ncbi:MULTISPECIES: 3-keto-5-aminohexanoate cleavage protein [Rhodopseudomonas]|uniref:3-keto-5-aminohexanoate cleavage protein n=1 Tax=Rhodopseudomonas palustris TaxID=1076 RepID=A0A0D7E6G9_RHOPL|nr:MULTISPECIES: 3-keto-5-aminohexanoate cleavage protein [Rhodopseudomonas]KIZ36433.1 3-keto-5-aminohexanoate cleavage protein [Rhodopseudomonas palustris]MDF3811514.1 3-keto-5-aminohexanoate cleavage protein [Rhodopseudomonas sp. BAL398]WOK15814.1 3-keto-5-aminohexanoate cleavage protein [Rhodopseudomonas sp. BAL398]
MSKLVITAAITGGVHVPSLSPYFPHTPAMVVEQAVGAAAAGAAVVHIHARDPKDSRPSSDVNVFEDIVSAIDQQCDAAICITTGGGLGMTPEERLKPVNALKPELASLNAGSMNFAIHPLADKIKQPKFDWEIPYLKSTEDLVFPNTFKSLKVFSAGMQAVGTKPELEVYDVGMINNIRYLIDTGALKTPVYLQFVMGILGGMPATPANLLFLVDTAQKLIGAENFVWSCCAAGRTQMPLLTLAMTLGGNVRVGLEDNLYIGPGELAKSSAEQVEKIIRIAKELNFEIASPADARQILGLKGQGEVGWAARSRSERRVATSASGARL